MIETSTGGHQGGIFPGKLPTIIYVPVLIVLYMLVEKNLFLSVVLAKKLNFEIIFFFSVVEVIYALFSSAENAAWGRPGMRGGSWRQIRTGVKNSSSSRGSIRKTGESKRRTKESRRKRTRERRRRKRERRRRTRGRRRRKIRESRRRTREIRRRRRASAPSPTPGKKSWPLGRLQVGLAGTRQTFCCP